MGKTVFGIRRKCDSIRRSAVCRTTSSSSRMGRIDDTKAKTIDARTKSIGATPSHDASCHSREIISWKEKNTETWNGFLKIHSHKISIQKLLRGNISIKNHSLVHFFMYYENKWKKSIVAKKKWILSFTHLVRWKLSFLAYQQQIFYSFSLSIFEPVNRHSRHEFQWNVNVIFHISHLFNNRTKQFEWNNFVNNFFNSIDSSVCDVRRLKHIDEWLLRDLGKCVCIVNLSTANLHGYRYCLRIDMRKCLVFNFPKFLPVCAWSDNNRK